MTGIQFYRCVPLKFFLKALKFKTLSFFKQFINLVLGKKINEINTDFHSIPTENLSKGIYFVRVYSDKGIAVKKLIIK